MRALLAALALAALAPAAAQDAISLWRWNGVTLRLEAQGDSRQFLIEDIPPSLARQLGIAPGAIFWQGQRRGERLVGEALLYQAGCPALPYAMDGSARIGAGGAIALRGQRPLRAPGDCAVQAGTAPEVMVLKYISRAAPAEGGE